MVAALDRCRSYRQDTHINCSILAVDNALVTSVNPIEYDRHRICRISFSKNGFLDSQKAALSYALDSDMGYIWLVDTGTKRDCKGEWHMREGKASWWMVCKDGLKAEGEMTPPYAGDGNGSGMTSDGKPVRFVFVSDEASD